MNGVERRGAQVRLTYWTREARLAADLWFAHVQHGRAPIPISIHTKRFIGINRIDASVLEYLELYPAWVHMMKARGLPIGVVNGRVTDRSLRIQGILKKAAQRLDFFWAQSERDARNAERIGVRNSVIEVLGSTKRESLLYRRPPCSDQIRAAIGTFDLVVGSLHRDEHRDFCAAMSGFKGRVLVAPRYLSQVEHLLKSLRQRGVDVGLRSTTTLPCHQLVILDTVGELHAAYALSDVAIIGGTFGRRNGQNLLEPITVGSAVIFGPNTASVFDEAHALQRCGVSPAKNFKTAFDRVARGEFQRLDVAKIAHYFPRCTEGIISRLIGLN